MTIEINHSTAVSIVHQLLRGNRIFSVTNIKKDGCMRKYVICPKAFRDQIKGTGKPLDVHMHPNLIRVPDTTKGSFRTVNLATLTAIVADGFHYRVLP